MYSCYTVRSDHLQPGIAMNSDRHILLHAGHKTCVVTVERHGDGEGPIIEHGRVLHGHPRKRPGKHGLLLTGEKRRGGVLARVRTEDINFGFPSLFGDVSYRVGGEGVERVIFAQIGTHNSMVKDQLLRVKPRREVVIVDQQGAVMLLVVHKDCQFSFRPATTSDLERHLRRRIPTLRNQGAITWGRRALEAIDASPNTFAELERQAQRV